MSLGKLVQNIVGSLYLVAGPWTISRLCGRFKFWKYLGLLSYVIYKFPLLLVMVHSCIVFLW